MSPDDAPEKSADAGPPDEAPEESADAGPPERADEQALPVQSREDTDAAWGDAPEPGDDERFYRDRPPHWDSE